jgi:hypothetical protein
VKPGELPGKNERSLIMFQVRMLQGKMLATSTKAIAIVGRKKHQVDALKKQTRQARQLENPKK